MSNCVFHLNSTRSSSYSLEWSRRVIHYTTITQYNIKLSIVFNSNAWISIWIMKPCYLSPVVLLARFSMPKKFITCCLVDESLIIFCTYASRADLLCSKTLSCEFRTLLGGNGAVSVSFFNWTIKIEQLIEEVYRVRGGKQKRWNEWKSDRSIVTIE